MDVEALRRDIHTAFGDEPAPSDVGGSASGIPRSPEANAIRKAFGGRRWHEVPLSILSAFATSWPFLSSEEYRYYLPAFMLSAINSFYEANPIPEKILYSLTYPDLGDLQQVYGITGLAPDGQSSTARSGGALGQLTDAYANGALERAFLERVSALTGPQKRVILEFLEHLRDVHGDEFIDGEPQIAIDRYWAKAVAAG